MRRHYQRVLLGVATLAALSGCAYQDPLALPDLGPPARSSQNFPGSSPYYDYGNTYGYGSYGGAYGSSYRSGYDPYYYRGYPQYYSPGVVYVPYPVPCADANRNGRCDKRPPKDRDNDGDGHHDGNQGGGRDNADDGVRPPRLRDGPRQPGEGPRVRRDGGRDASTIAPYPWQVSPTQVRPPPPPPRRAAPAPQVQREVQREPRSGPRQRPASDDRPRTQEP